MTTNLYLDKRYADGSGLTQVKIAINHLGSTAYIGTGVRIPKEAWDAALHRVAKGYPNASRLNIILATKKLDVDNAIEELRKAGKLKGVSLSKMRTLIADVLSPDKEADSSSRFIARMERYRDSKKKQSTWDSYDQTIRRIREFDRRADSLTFEDVTYQWLVRFDSFMADTAPSANARSIKMRNIRTVFNEAINDEITTVYPFRRFKIKSEATKNRALTRDQLRSLFDYPCAPGQREYLDMFKLSFLLAGINIVDLADLKEIRNGRIECRRAKTNQPFSVNVEPEAMEIINKYRGKDWLLNIRDRYKNHRDYLHRMNDALKRIGIHYDKHTKKSTGEPLFSDLSSYYARYSWANIAAELDVPNEVIDAALGHKARGIISVYVRLNYNRKVDEANRRVIDFVFGDQS